MIGQYVTHLLHLLAERLNLLFRDPFGRRPTCGPLRFESRDVAGLATAGRQSKPGMATHSEVPAERSLSTPSAGGGRLSSGCSGVSLRLRSSASGGTSCSFRNPIACICTCTTDSAQLSHKMFFLHASGCPLGNELPMTDRTGGGLNSITIAVFPNFVTSQGFSVVPWANAAKVTHQLLQLLWSRMVCFI